ncbi:hypothetical protein DSECCO2_289650 [anaerobic digester metagenome]
MKINAWKRRLAERSDLSTSLVHLTKDKKGNNALSAMDVLIKILKEKRLIGSNSNSGFICGGIPAVCFQDTPLYQLTENIYYEQKMRQAHEYTKVRYLGIGLMFDKVHIYKKGGRPVIYEKKETAKRFLPANEYWRIVNYNLDDENEIIDWTHEREWRIKNDFDFELSDVIVILPKCSNIETFIKKYKKEFNKDPYSDLKGIIPLQEIFF